MQSVDRFIHGRKFLFFPGLRMRTLLFITWQLPNGKDNLCTEELKRGLPLLREALSGQQRRISMLGHQRTQPERPWANQLKSASEPSDVSQHCTCLNAFMLNLRPEIASTNAKIMHFCRPVSPSPLIKDLRERLPKDAAKVARFNTNVYYEK